MAILKPIKGFSKLSKEAKIEWLSNNYFHKDENTAEALLKSYWNNDEAIQKLHDEFIENTITNFYLPFGIAPNFLIDGKIYCLPMAIEESSVVAAAAKAANYWVKRGGFKTKIISTKKIGHVHFIWNGAKDKLQRFFESLKPILIKNTNAITKNMRQRGGGILDIELVDKTNEEPDYYQLKATFETCDSMGANFINSVLEEFARTLKAELFVAEEMTEEEREVTIVMCILSNYTPECIVRSEVSCKVKDLVEEGDGITADEFVFKFQRAIRIAEIEPYRATTHNKGIMNGIDSVVIATGNDFRAVEACAHAYASRTGQYKSLTGVDIKDDTFIFYLEIPLALGTVGGITALHPMVKFAYQMLGNPNAQELMKITACAGLAQNFSAIRSLITSGIQKGHMKMHLLNILNQFGATEKEKEQVIEYFKDKVVSYHATENVLHKIRNKVTL